MNTLSVLPKCSAEQPTKRQGAEPCQLEEDDNISSVPTSAPVSDGAGPEPSTAPVDDMGSSGMPSLQAEMGSTDMPSLVSDEMAIDEPTSSALAPVGTLMATAVAFLACLY